MQIVNNINISGHYLRIEGLLKQEEIRNLEKLVATASFVDDSSTASDAAKSVKNNLQIPKSGSLEKQQIDAVFFHAISNSPLMADVQVGIIRSDVAMTLFLSDPDTYSGGELCIMSPVVRSDLN